MAVASTKDRILSVIQKSQKDDHGWVPYNLSIIHLEISDKSRTNLQVQVSELIKEGKLEVQREGRFIKKVRPADHHSVEDIKNGSKSQTEKMLHYLYGIADPKGAIRGDIDIRHLQLTLGFRDFHDTNKALHNLNKLGILEIRQSRLTGGEDHRITKMRLRVEKQKSWPIDMMTDEELPGKPDIQEDEDEMREGEATPTIEETTEFSEPDPTPSDSEQVALVSNISESDDNTIEDFEQTFPLIAQRVDIYRKRIRAREALSDAGELELAELLTEKLSDPLDKELLRLMIAAGYYG